MNYTSLDIQNLKIKKSMMGYDEDMVNEILDKVAEDYQAYIRENSQLKDKVSVLNDGIEHYKNMEDSLQNALLLAQKTSEDVKKNASDSAKNIIAQAEIEAAKIVADAKKSLNDVKAEYNLIKNKVEEFKIKYMNALKTELMVLENLEIVSPVSEDLEAQVEQENAQNIPHVESEEIVSKPISRMPRQNVNVEETANEDEAYALFEPEV